MAFKSFDLSILAYANNFTLWHYTTIDNSATITGAGYFNSVTDMLRVGDMILTNMDVEGEVTTKIYVVNSAKGEVTISLLSL